LKKLEAGQALQLLGNFGVIVGILLLVYELNQNRDLMMAQTRNELSQGIVEMLLTLSDDEESASVWSRGSQGDELAERELARYLLMANAEARYQENVHYQYRQGLYDETEFEAQRELWGILFRAKGRVDAFCALRSGLSPEYVAEIDLLLTTYRCE
jgi:hypothetical protein